jgi:hypothetical protein
MFLCFAVLRLTEPRSFKPTKNPPDDLSGGLVGNNGYGSDRIFARCS